MEEFDGEMLEVAKVEVRWDSVMPRVIPVWWQIPITASMGRGATESGRNIKRRHKYAWAANKHERQRLASAN